MKAEALALCVKGSKVLKSMPYANCDIGPVRALQRKGRNDVTMEDVFPIFTRLGILSTLFGQPIETGTPLTVLIEAAPPELSFSFRALTEARDALYNLMDTCQAVLQAAMIYKWGPHDGPVTLEALYPLQGRMLVNLRN